MIERYNCYGWDIRRGEMRPEQDGQWVRHSDYAALEAKLAEANKDTALAVLNERTKAAVRDIERDSEVAGLKIALEQAWQSNRDRADIIAALEAAPPAPKVTDEMVSAACDAFLRANTTVRTVGFKEMRAALKAAMEAGKP